MITQLRDYFTKVLRYIPTLILGIIIVFIPIFYLAGYHVLAQEEVNNNSGINSTLFTETPLIPNVNTSFAPKVITISHGIKRYQAIVYGQTVKDALIEIGFTNFDNYTIKPSLETDITSRIHISVKDFRKERRIEFEEIPFTAKTVIDNEREIDTITLVQDGKTGKKRLVVEYIYIDGILEQRNIVREEIITRAQDEVTALGTKRVFREMTINGDTFMYWKKLRVWATSYDSSCEGCNNYTATGAYLRKGVIATDPRVIPLYTNMYVPGYGFGQALDVGGAIKGNKIDLGFEDLRLVQGQWSARYVDIYLLD